VIRRAALLAVLLIGAMPAAAQDVVADLSQSKVAITASFAGSHILVFGAVRYEPGQSPDADPTENPLDVIVTVSGPLEPVTVRKKARRAGIWINTEALEIDAAPTLYKIATSRPQSEILSETEDLRHRISIPLAIRAVGTIGAVSDANAFTEALIRIRQKEGLYEELPGSVGLAEQTLFRTTISLPSNLVEGQYTTRIYLTRNKQVVAEYTRVLDVRKVGIERWIYNLAQDQALLYGLLSLAIAIAAGWSASAVFRYIRS
jgi:uncharacterized protein (TIGR02186 family)